MQNLSNPANKPEFHTTNPHGEHFEQFENTRLMERLQKKFTPKPYWKAYGILRAVVLITSYLFNVLSAATASVLVFLFTRGLIGNDIAAGVVTVAALAALEMTKRETSGRFFGEFFQFRKMSPGLAAAALLLMAISTAASYHGAKRAVKDFTPPPAQIAADSVTAPLMAQVAAVDAQIKTASGMKWKGKTTATAQRTIEQLSQQKTSLLSEITRQRQRIDGANDTAQVDHRQAVTLSAAQFGMFTLTCEILLILCLAYCEYYDYRSYAEQCRQASAANDTNTKAPIQAASLAAEMAQRSNGNGASVMHARADEIRLSDTPTITITTEANTRPCLHCGTAYTVGHKKQKYCSDACRIAAWEQSNGKVLRGKYQTT